ncbi:monocarboxylate transporter 4-like isoform X2 [Dendronephthya gigantea]|uniref:monocarboxylate transporter 4-like isoform X2 n=1 Tax=Dendronephthya gigantea TaxID=151771 RepID=UPI0010694E03|nr:monocarboxylate transporter 4-like isoform X2 [Dendronephthya gigantea]
MAELIRKQAGPVLFCCVAKEPPSDLDCADGGMLRRKQENNVKIVDCLHVTLSLLKDRRILLILSGNALFSVVEYIPNMFVIQYARSLGYPISKSKWLLVTFSLLSIVSRSTFGCVADYVMKLNKMSVLLSAVVVLFGISSACFSSTQSLVILAVYMGGIGILDGMYWVMLSFVAMEISDPRHSDIVFTLILFSQAFGYLIGPPAIGFFYDLNGNFSHVLYAVGAAAVTAGIFILAGALLKPTNSQLLRKMTKSLVGTSELKCSLVVFERETVL